MNAVLKLLEWAWQMLTEEHASSDDLSHLAFVATSSVYLLQTYIQEAYPKQVKPGKKTKDSAELAEVVYRAQTILRHILSSRRHLSRPPSVSTHEKEESSMMELVVKACSSVFRSCFHAFYPTKPLKWWALCQHLQLMDPVSAGGTGCLPECVRV